MKFLGYPSFKEWWNNLGYKHCYPKDGPPYRYHDIEFEWLESIVTGYIGNSAKVCKRCGYREVTPYGLQQQGFRNQTPANMKWEWCGENGRTIGWRLVPK